MRINGMLADLVESYERGDVTAGELIARVRELAWWARFKDRYTLIVRPDAVVSDACGTRSVAMHGSVAGNPDYSAAITIERVCGDAVPARPLPAVFTLCGRSLAFNAGPVPDGDAPVRL